MTIREQLQAWHREMGLPYTFPQLEPEKFPVLTLHPHGALAVKLIGEAFLWLDPRASEYRRAKALLELGAQAKAEAWRAGFDEISAWIPPQIVERFQPGLRKLGWQPSPWPSWSIRL